MDSPSKTYPEGMEQDFIWEEYLEETNSVSAPPTAFAHVEYSLESGFKVGMKLEVQNQDDKNNYWLASVVMTCGPLLSLRYAGYGDDRSADFWFNIKSGEFHPVGWCSANDKKLWPPKDVLEKHEDIDSLIAEEFKNVKSIPASLSEDLDAGIMPIDQIKCGMKLEIIEEMNPNNMWIATVVQNVGGRLQLKYDGISSSSDCWLFYLSDQIQPLNYGHSNNLRYSLPQALKSEYSEEEQKKIFDSVMKDSETAVSFPAHVLEPRIPLESHEFKEGMKLEAVDVSDYKNVCPATVFSVINDYYFLVSIDAYNSADTEKNKHLLCCNSNSQFIMPINWANENGVPLKPPNGYELKDSEFKWDDYLKYCNANPAPSEIFPMRFMNMGFETGMKLEVANPLVPDKIHVATIEKIVEPLMWVHFDTPGSNQQSFITNINSFDIFPVGWCGSNSFPLQTSHVGKPKSVPLKFENSNVEQKHAKCSVRSGSNASHKEHGKSWCPKIYFNHRCFTGPLLSKSRLAELPKAIGPGPVTLVMKEVLTRLINIAYKSSRVLHELQVHSKPSPDMHQQVIKAKYKGKSYRATVEYVRHSEQVEEFCRKICQKLECCSYLFGPKYIEDVCPDNCHTQTKTKFGYYFGKKHKKPGRPPLASTIVSNSGEIVKKGPGRKKKRKHWRFLSASANEGNEAKKTKLSDEKEESDESGKEKSSLKDEDDTSPNKVVNGKKKVKHLPKYEIVTRGAKLPNFGLWHHHISPFHSRRGRPRTRPPLVNLTRRKVGRPLGSTKKAINEMNSKKQSEETGTSNNGQKDVIIEPKTSFLKSNPLHWSVEEVVHYLKGTECAPLAPLLKEQEIDGQALLLLNFPNVQEFLHLKMEPAMQFCHLIKSLKLEFFRYFANEEK